MSLRCRMRITVSESTCTTVYVCTTAYAMSHRPSRQSSLRLFDAVLAPPYGHSAQKGIQSSSKTKDCKLLRFRVRETLWLVLAQGELVN